VNKIKRILSSELMYGRTLPAVTHWCMSVSDYRVQTWTLLLVETVSCDHRQNTTFTAIYSASSFLLGRQRRKKSSRKCLFIFITLANNRKLVLSRVLLSKVMVTTTIRFNFYSTSFEYPTTIQLSFNVEQQSNGSRIALNESRTASNRRRIEVES